MLLVLNLRALERLFPDFRAWLKTIGAAYIYCFRNATFIRADSSLACSIGPPEGMFYVDGTLVPPPKEHYPGGMPDVFSMSRSAYETLLRALVARIPNIRFTKGIVTGVTPSPDDGKRLGSVTYRNGDGSNAHAVQKADLIVGARQPSLGLKLVHDASHVCRLQRISARRIDVAWARRLPDAPEGDVQPAHAVLYD